MSQKSFWLKFTPWILLGLLAMVHLSLISKTFFVDEFGNFKVAVAGYGDIPLHLTQISKFAFNKLDNLNDPIYYGAKLQYPFVLNFISGVLLRISQNWVIAVVLPTMILCVANIILLMLIYKRFLKKSFWAALAVIIFFLGSGWGAYPLISQAIQKNQSASALIQELGDKDISATNKYDAKANEQNIDFGSPLTMSFLHQRTFFLGFFGFLLLWLLVLQIKIRTKWYWIVSAGLILGLLPLWHSHSFIAAVIFLSVWLTKALLSKNKQDIIHLVIVSSVGLVIALPQIIYLASSKEVLSSGADFINFRLGWMVEAGIGSVQFGNSTPGIWNWRFLEFLWMNFGLILPFFLISILILVNKKVRKILTDQKYAHYGIYAFLGLSFFFINQIIKFQPWDFDNNKILVYWLVFASPLVVFWLMKLAERKKIWGSFFAALCVFIFVVSGLLDLLPRLYKDRSQMPIIFDVSARSAAQFIKQNIKENELILTGTSHLNPVASLAGREVLVGYPGWLWTRGINYQERETELRNFYQNPSRSNEFIKKYPIKYILFDNTVQYDFGAQKYIFEQSFNKIFEAGDYIIYKI